MLFRASLPCILLCCVEPAEVLANIEHMRKVHSGAMSSYFPPTNLNYDSAGSARLAKTPKAKLCLFFLSELLNLKLRSLR